VKRIGTRHLVVMATIVCDDVTINQVRTQKFRTQEMAFTLHLSLWSVFDETEFDSGSKPYLGMTVPVEEITSSLCFSPTTHSKDFVFICFELRVFFSFSGDVFHLDRGPIL